MDIQTIAVAATALLGPYLAKAGDAFAKKAGEQLVEKASTLYQVVKAKFKGDGYAEQTLARVEEKPEAEGRRAALKEVLLEKMENDVDFAETMRRLVEEAQEADTHKIIVFGARNIVATGGVSRSTLITGNDNIVDDPNRS